MTIKSKDFKFVTWLSLELGPPKATELVGYVERRCKNFKVVLKAVTFYLWFLNFLKYRLLSVPCVSWSYNTSLYSRSPEEMNYLLSAFLVFTY